MRKIAALVAGVWLLVVTTSAAGKIDLNIHDGRVWLVAHDATLREILAEWSRIGQTHIVNADRLTGGRVSLELSDVPERGALDVLLRSAAGYLAAPRPTVVANASKFDRIVIVATSSPVTNAPAAFPAPAAAAPPPVQQQQPPPVLFQQPPGAQRVIGPDGQPVPDDQEDGQRPAAPGRPPGPFPQTAGEAPQQPPVQQPPPPATPTAAPAAPGGASTPGMIVQQPPPQPGAPQQPGAQNPQAPTQPPTSPGQLPSQPGMPTAPPTQQRTR